MALLLVVLVLLLLLLPLFIVFVCGCCCCCCCRLSCVGVAVAVDCRCRVWAVLSVLSWWAVLSVLCVGIAVVVVCVRKVDCCGLCTIHVLVTCVVAFGFICDRVGVGVSALSSRPCFSIGRVYVVVLYVWSAQSVSIDETVTMATSRSGKQAKRRR